MFEKIGRLAETAATNVSLSRRGFFGRLGRGALVAAGALGGVLTVAVPVQAGKETYMPCCGSRGGCYVPPGCVFVETMCDYYPGYGNCAWSCPGGTYTFTTCKTNRFKR
jgi:hypothetical protein